MYQVLFTQAQMKQYRVPFFEKLHALLLRDGIEVKVAYSDPPEVDRAKGDNVDLPPDIGIKVPGYWLFGDQFFYQGLMLPALEADLVVAEQANKHLHEFILLLLRLLRVKRIAFWGLGRNTQPNHSWLSERLRPWIARRASWWFTYTKGTASWLVANGLAPEKITVMQNSTDTRTLTMQIARIPDERLEEVRRRLEIEAGSHVGIYCGILTADKGIALLLEAVQLVRKRIPNFHLLVLGGGPECTKVEVATQQASWIHYLGPKFGEEKALLLKISDCFLLPGRVGLAILDSFAAGLPLITTHVPFHGPEVEYLEDGVNGKMASNSVEAYAGSVVEVLSDVALLDHLKSGAHRSAERYSIEAMVENCRRGVLACVGASNRTATPVHGMWDTPPPSSERYGRQFGGIDRQHIPCQGSSHRRNQ